MTLSATRQSKKQQYDPNKGYEELAQSLIELMEKGVNPFRRSWTRESQHTNFVTGDEYQNGNLICLEIARITLEDIRVLIGWDLLKLRSSD